MIFVCAHGAGGHKDDRSMQAVARALEGIVEVVRFNFPYRELGSGRPDAMPVLKKTIADIAAGKNAIIGGRSMGGRAASMLAADGFPCRGLLLLAYPLHPAGQPERVRTEHLPKIKVPVLCINGTRDALCRRDLMEKVVPASWTLHWLEGADHSFHVLKSSGRTDADVMEEVATATRTWLAAL